MKKTENDYIAEYVKQKHPEILQSLDFLCWKAGHILCDVLKEATDAIVAMFKGLSLEDIKELKEELKEDQEEGGSVKTVEEMREEYENMMENYQAAKERGDYEEALNWYEKAQSSWEPEGSESE